MPLLSGRFWDMTSREQVGAFVVCVLVFSPHELSVLSVWLHSFVPRHDSEEQVSKGIDIGHNFYSFCSWLRGWSFPRTNISVRALLLRIHIRPELLAFRSFQTMFHSRVWFDFQGRRACMKVEGDRLQSKPNSTETLHMWSLWTRFRNTTADLSKSYGGILCTFRSSFMFSRSPCRLQETWRFVREIF
jgi:hypothetical protein